LLCYLHIKQCNTQSYDGLQVESTTFIISYNFDCLQ
jgi:hypothetical protein